MVEQLIKEYQLQVEHIEKGGNAMHLPNSVTISEGNNEGYYISVMTENARYIIRQHNYNEALKILGVMLKVINPNK